MDRISGKPIKFMNVYDNDELLSMEKMKPYIYEDGHKYDKYMLIYENEDQCSTHLQLHAVYTHQKNVDNIRSDMFILGPKKSLNYPDDGNSIIIDNPLKLNFVILLENYKTVYEFHEANFLEKMFCDPSDFVYESKYDISKTCKLYIVPITDEME